MFFASVSELRRALDAREISSVELTTDLLARIERSDAGLNSFITVDRDGALAAARAADERIARGEADALTGIALAHKDLFCTEGVLTTCGSRMLANFVSPYDAHVVSLLKAAGAVSLGKTNMDEFAMGSSNETSYYGAVKNPWQTAHVSGGSSGGSAAAVAAGLTPLATGTDTGGSVRQPAAFCGITGIKPTYGLVSRYGMIAYASSFDQGGAMARSALDCAHLLGAMTGFDVRDATSIKREHEDYAAQLATPAANSERPLQGLRLGLVREFSADGMSADTAATFERTRQHYEALGAQCKEVSLAHAATLSVPAYYVLSPAEASSNLSRFDGVRYGHRSEQAPDLESLYCNSRGEGFGEEVKRRILIGTYVLSHGYYDAYYLQAQRLRRLISDDFLRAFEHCDLILAPVAPGTAWKMGEKNDPVSVYRGDLYTLPANLAGLPALSHPAGFSAAGLPIGMQLIGPHFGEARLLLAAHHFQRDSDWHLRQPAAFAAP